MRRSVPFFDLNWCYLAKVLQWTAADMEETEAVCSVAAAGQQRMRQSRLCYVGRGGISMDFSQLCGAAC